MQTENEKLISESKGTTFDFDLTSANIHLVGETTTENDESIQNIPNFKDQRSEKLMTEISQNISINYQSQEDIE